MGHWIIKLDKEHEHDYPTDAFVGEVWECGCETRFKRAPTQKWQVDFSTYGPSDYLPALEGK